MSEDAVMSRRSGEQDRRIAEAIEREEGRLRRFVRRRIADASDVEDILQDVFYELVLAYRLARPIENAGAWMFEVARNRITDLFRRRTSVELDEPRRAASAGIASLAGSEGDEPTLADLLPSTAEGPDAVLARRVALAELERALAELPHEQREIFIAHELEGRSFRELAQESGLPLNTLLSRKHYAVVRLRRRLHAFYEESKRG